MLIDRVQTQKVQTDSCQTDSRKLESGQAGRTLVTNLLIGLKNKMNYSTGEPHMCIFFFWYIVVTCIMSQTDACDRLMNCLWIGWLACCPAGWLVGWPAAWPAGG